MDYPHSYTDRYPHIALTSVPKKHTTMRAQRVSCFCSFAARSCSAKAGSTMNESDMRRFIYETRSSSTSLAGTGRLFPALPQRTWDIVLYHPCQQSNTAMLCAS